DRGKPSAPVPCAAQDVVRPARVVRGKDGRGYDDADKRHEKRAEAEVCKGAGRADAVTVAEVAALRAEPVEGVFYHLRRLLVFLTERPLQSCQPLLVIVQRPLGRDVRRGQGRAEFV